MTPSQVRRQAFLPQRLLGQSLHLSTPAGLHNQQTAGLGCTRSTCNEERCRKLANGPNRSTDERHQQAYPNVPLSVVLNSLSNVWWDPSPFCAAVALNPVVSFHFRARLCVPKGRQRVSDHDPAHSNHTFPMLIQHKQNRLLRKKPTKLSFHDWHDTLAS